MVSYLPLSHIAAQIYDLWTGIQWGAQVCFAEPDALKVSPSAEQVSECVGSSIPMGTLMGGGGLACALVSRQVPHAFLGQNSSRCC